MSQHQIIELHIEDFLSILKRTLSELLEEYVSSVLQLYYQHIIKLHNGVLPEWVLKRNTIALLIKVT